MTRSRSLEGIEMIYICDSCVEPCYHEDPKECPNQCMYEDGESRWRVVSIRELVDAYVKHGSKP